MGADRCGWVRLGAGGMRNTKTRQTGGIYGLIGQDLGPMVGEISPTSCLCKTKVKWAQIDSEWAYRGLHGCSGIYFHGGARKQGETRSKIGDQGIFLQCGHGQKTHVVGRDGRGGQRGQTSVGLVFQSGF